MLAHELGHYLHGHLWKGITASLMSTAVLFAVADHVCSVLLPAAGVAGIADVAGLPVLAFVLGVLSIAVMPAGNALSRRFERQADAAALRLSTEPAAMIATFEKLADHNLADRRPPPLVSWWFGSHPPIDARIAAVRTYVRAHAADGAGLV